MLLERINIYNPQIVGKIHMPQTCDQSDTKLLNPNADHETDYLIHNLVSLLSDSSTTKDRLISKCVAETSVEMDHGQVARRSSTQKTSIRKWRVRRTTILRRQHAQSACFVYFGARRHGEAARHHTHSQGCATLVRSDPRNKAGLYVMNRT